MRIFLFLALVGCAGGQHVAFQPLPELVAIQPPAKPLVAEHAILVPGERIVWDVQAKGFSIARAELTVGDGNVHSHVETSALAAMAGTITHDLVTVIDPETNAPRSASETLVKDGSETHIDALFTADGYAIDGAPHRGLGVHDLHTALGVLRGWAELDAHAGFLDVVVAGQLHRLEVNQPLAAEVLGKQAMRVDCRVLPENATVAIWFASTSDRTPLRIEIASGQGSTRVAAELLERTVGSESL